MQKIISINYIKKKIPSRLKNYLGSTINRKELFTFLFKYTPHLLIKFLLKLKIKSIRTDTRNIKINISFKKSREDAHLFSILINKKRNYLNSFNIFFSNSILDYITVIQRTIDCLNLWLPILIKISQESQKELISLDFATGDNGNKNFLSMEQKDNNNLIPDLYAFAAAYGMDKNISKLSLLEFKKNWISKEDKIFWRGSTTGKTYSSIEELDKLNRIKICRQFIDKKNIDLKISKIAQNLISTEKIKTYLLENNLFAEEVTE